jgi:endoglucanase
MLSATKLKVKSFTYLLIGIFTLTHIGAKAQILNEKNYIRVDQFGYLPNANKVAVIANAQQGFNAGTGIEPNTSKKAEVRKVSDNSLVYEGALNPWNNGATDALSGDKGWWFNFSAVTANGDYFIRIHKNSGFVDSYPFKISADVYANALKAATNMYYYQRCNIAKTGQYGSGAAWTDGPWYDRSNQDKNATLHFQQSTTKDVSKGWIDAGDPNKYVSFAGDVIHDLLTSYEQHTAMWSKFNLNIPESNNSIPDLLDEIKYETDFVLNMCDDATGGIHTKAGILNDGAYISPPSTDSRTRYYDRVCPSSSIMGAGMLAHSAIHFSKFPELETYAKNMITKAERAWDYYENSNDKAARCDNGEIEAGDADGPDDQYPKEHVAEAACSAIYLYAATGKETYHTFFKANYKQLRPWKAKDWGVYRSNQSEAVLFYLTLNNADAGVKQDILDKKKSAEKSQGSYYDNIESENLYRANTFYSNWGSNSLMSRQGADNMDFLAYNILPNDHGRFKDKAQAIVNYIHGVNPFGVCYLSNMYMYGAEYCADEMWHTWFKPGTVYDNINGTNVGPAPGYLSGGHNKSWNTEAIVKVGTTNFTVKVKDQPTQKAWTCDNETQVPWAYNEPGIYYNSGYIKMLAHFVAGNAEPVAATGIAINPKTSNMLKGETVQLRAVFTPSTTTNQSSKWISSNIAVASVNASGLVKAEGIGTATITSTSDDGGFTATSTVTVSETAGIQSCGQVENFGFEAGLGKWLNVFDAVTTGTPAKSGERAAIVSGQGGVNYEKKLDVTAGKELTFKFWGRVEGSPADAMMGIDYFDANQKEITEDIFKVNTDTYKEYGVVKTIPANVTSIGIWSWKQGGSGKLFLDDVCLSYADAAVFPVTAVKLSIADVTIEAGKQTKLEYTLEPSNATTMGVTWKSSDPSIATVDENGTVNALKEGKVSITATSKDPIAKTATAMITVIKATIISVSAVKLDIADAKIEVGQELKINFSIEPNNVTVGGVTWKSSDINIATVNESGTVKGIKEGQVTITATSKDAVGKTATAKITVNQPVLADEKPAIVTENMLYPNPATTNIQVPVYNKKATMAQITVVNLEGKITNNQLLSLTKGQQIIKFDVSNLNKDVYIMKVLMGGEYRNFKFVKK